jgi:hypothetical protein
MLQQRAENINRLNIRPGALCRIDRNGYSGSFASILARWIEVRSTPVSGAQADVGSLPVRAKTRLMHRSKRNAVAPLFDHLVSALM